MQKLTEFRFEGTPRVQAWCEVCGKWIKKVGIEKDCFMLVDKEVKHVDYIFCLECNTAIARSQ